MGINPDELTHSDIEKLAKAANSHGTGRATRDSYFQGDVVLDKLGIKIPTELDIFRTVLNYGRIFAEAQLDRMILDGFRSTDKRAEKAAADIYRRNKMREDSLLVFQEAIVQKRAYLIVGPDGNGKAAITSHTASGIHVEYDPVTRKVLWGFQTWGNSKERRGTLYLPGLNIDYVRPRGGNWIEDGERRKTGITETAISPVINRAQLGDFRGRSDLDYTSKFTDAGARTFTNLQIAGESIALPHRAFFGVDDESKPQTPHDHLKAYLSRTSFWKEADGKAIQLPGADLRNFKESLELISRGVGGHTGLPLDYLGITSDNPSSAEAITRGEARLIKRIKRKMALFGEAYEHAMLMALELEGITGVEIEAIWQAPETPNLAGLTDSVVKLRAPGPDGRPLISADTGRKMIGMSPEERAREATAIEDEFNGISAGWAA